MVSTLFPESPPTADNATSEIFLFIVNSPVLIAGTKKVSFQPNYGFHDDQDRQHSHHPLHHDHLHRGTQVVPFWLMVNPGQQADTVRIFGTIWSNVDK